MTATDLHSDVKMLTELLADLAKDVNEYREGYVAGPGIEPDILALELLRAAKTELANIEHGLDQNVARRMPADEPVLIEGVPFVRGSKNDRKAWQKDALLMDVLDSRLVSPTTGEIREETEKDKILAVWNLGTPRTTALRARGLNPDLYCETTWGGYTVRRLDH